MQLNENDADLFFKLTWELQLYINEKVTHFNNIKTTDDLHNADMEDKMSIREALYKNLNLIDDFVKENPATLNDDELTIVASWKKGIRGTFYIERLLKKHAIFIQEDAKKVFAVHALHASFSDMFHKSQLPKRVEVALLPFKGVIVYDGLLQGYNIHFGSGIRNRLKEDYMRAKQNQRIIETFDKKIATKAKPAQTAKKSYKKELQQLEKTAKKLRGGANQPMIESPVFSLLKASISLAQQATTEKSDVGELWKEYERVRRALNKTYTVISRMD